MSFRPQFPWKTPEGWQDEEFVQYFDPTNTPGLSTSLAAGQSALGIPLLLEPGIEYHIRGIEIASAASDVNGVRLKDPWGNYLSDDFVPAGAYSGGQESAPGGLPVVIEGEIVCPPGGTFTVDIKNLS